MSIQAIQNFATSAMIEPWTLAKAVPRKVCDSGSRTSFFQLTRMLLQVLAVKPIQIGEVLLLRRAAQVGRRVQVEDSRFTRTHDRALIHRRQPAIRPVLDTLDRQAIRVGEDNESR